MAAVHEIAEATSTKEAVLGLLLLFLPVLAGGLALKFRARRAERIERSVEHDLRAYVLEQGGTVVEPTSGPETTAHDHWLSGSPAGAWMPRSFRGPNS